jgi:hypothetical protein
MTGTQSLPIGQEEPTQRERLSAIQHFLDWIYQPYGRADDCYRDCHIMLRALRVGEKTLWGSRRLAAFIDAQAYSELQDLRQTLYATFEGQILPTSGGAAMARGFTGLERVLWISPVGDRPTPSEDATYTWLYRTEPVDQPTGEAVAHVVLCRLGDLLDGLYVNVLVRCAECGRYTVRGSGRDKAYCSVLCRVKAGQKKRRATLAALAHAHEKEKITQGEEGQKQTGQGRTKKAQPQRKGWQLEEPQKAQIKH